MQFMKMAVWEFSQHFCDYPSTTRDEMKTPTEFPCTRFDEGARANWVTCWPLLAQLMSGIVPFSSSETLLQEHDESE
jgi:hypothetical protein